MAAKSSPHFVFVMGTTASGKSEIALNLALRFGGSIVNCDSLQVYRGLDIGTAKPSVQEQKRVPHHLFSSFNYPQVMTAGEYIRLFYQMIDENPDEKIFFVVGGTGFYFKAIEKGMYPVQPPRPELKAQIERELLAPDGPRVLFQELQSRDPDYAKKIHLADHYRLVRGIEVLRAEGRTITEIQKEFLAQETEFPFPLLKIGPQRSREVLADRIRSRTTAMLSAGLIDETLGVIERGWGDWSPLTAVGYREVIQYLRELKSIDWLQGAIEQSTRQLAKKQRTWFQRDPDIHWFDPEQESELVHLDRVVMEFLASSI